MRAEREDRLAYRHGKKSKIWLVITLITAANIFLFLLLAKSGWGIVIDRNKLIDAFSITNDKASLHIQIKDHLNETGTNTQPRLVQSAQQKISPEEPKGDTSHISSGREQLPLSYEISLATFNRVFIPHPSCAPSDMKWTQMDCSNFRARAMKRFHTEWGKGAYWKEGKPIENAHANRIVNSEIYEQ